MILVDVGVNNGETRNSRIVHLGDSHLEVILRFWEPEKMLVFPSQSHSIGSHWKMSNVDLFIEIEINI